MPIVIAIGIRLLSYALTHQMDERKSSSCVRPLLRPNFATYLFVCSVRRMRNS